LPVVLAAEDDESSRVLLQEAFNAAGVAVDLRLVENGRDLLDYLQSREPWGKASYNRKLWMSRREGGVS
jgi:CheY-like chemotaxis protein